MNRGLKGAETEEDRAAGGQRGDGHVRQGTVVDRAHRELFDGRFILW